jgi:aryl-alcohol dehydrogenase-like predicted oxidoreductase
LRKIDTAPHFHRKLAAAGDELVRWGKVPHIGLSNVPAGGQQWGMANGDYGMKPPFLRINWVANQSGVTTVLVGATRQSQLDDNLASLDFELPVALRSRLDVVGTNNLDIQPPY